MTNSHLKQPREPLTFAFYTPRLSSYVRTHLSCSTWNIVRTITRHAKSRLRSFFDRLSVHTPPKIPARNRALRSPRFRDLKDHIRLRPLTFLVVLLDGSLHAVIADRQNIRTPQGEHQEHVRRPDADALDLGEMRYHFFFRHFRHALELQQAGCSFLGEVAQIRRLLPGQPDATHFGIGQFENALRGQRVAGKSGEAIEDGHGRFAVQLLIEDRLGEGMKGGLVKLHAAWPYALDNRGQHGVGFLQVTDCKVVGRFAHRLWLLAGRASLAYRRTNSELPFRHSIRVSPIKETGIKEKPGKRFRFPGSGFISLNFSLTRCRRLL